jgi:hypothetical protein
MNPEPQLTSTITPSSPRRSLRIVKKIILFMTILGISVGILWYTRRFQEVVIFPTPTVSQTSTSPNLRVAELEQLAADFQVIVGDGLLKLLAEGREQEIYEGSSSFLKQVITFEQFRQFIATYPILRSNPPFELVGITPFDGTISGVLVSAIRLTGNLGVPTEGKQVKLELQFVRDNGTYLLSKMRIYTEEILLRSTPSRTTTNP